MKDGHDKVIVSVITLHNVRHYGSVLQAVATAELIRQQGHRPIFVDYWRSDFRDTADSYLLRSSWNRNLLTRTVFRTIKRPGILRAKGVFDSFTDAHIELTERRYTSPGEINADPPPADAYCVGSDQVWNRAYNRDGSGPFYLEFAPNESPKFSLASSMGGAVVDPDGDSDLIRALRGFASVSVREGSLADSLSVSGIDATRLVDPTLAIDASVWNNLAAPVSTKGRYILVYQLKPSREFDLRVRELKERLGVPVIRIEYGPNLRSLGKRVKRLPTVPEFLGLIRGAEFVLTDSFHGYVFSTLFCRQIGVVLPRAYSGRLLELADLLGDRDEVVANGSPGANRVRLIDYGRVTARVEAEGSRVRQYLGKVLSSIEAS